MLGATHRYIGTPGRIATLGRIGANGRAKLTAAAAPVKAGAAGPTALYAGTLFDPYFACVPRRFANRKHICARRHALSAADDKRAC
jgi:hypothetical protein